MHECTQKLEDGLVWKTKSIEWQREQEGNEGMIKTHYIHAQKYHNWINKIPQLSKPHDLVGPTWQVEEIPTSCFSEWHMQYTYNINTCDKIILKSLKPIDITNIY